MKCKECVHFPVCCMTHTPESNFANRCIYKLLPTPKGEWTEHSAYKGVLICSHCNRGETQAYDTFKFCPYCGADMKGDET